MEETNDLEMLCKFLKACQLLGEVSEHNSQFTNDLMPSITEQFMVQATDNIQAIEKKLRIG